MWIRTEDDSYFDWDAKENEETFEEVTDEMNYYKYMQTKEEVEPCSKRCFIESYLEKDPEFEQTIAEDFGIEWM